MIKNKNILFIILIVVCFHTQKVYGQDCIPETNLVYDVIKCDTLYLC